MGTSAGCKTVGSDNRPNAWVTMAPENMYSSTFGGTRWAPRRSNNYSWLAKLTYRPTSTSKISYSYNESVVIDQNTQAIQTTLEHDEPNPGYQYLFQYIPDSANTFTQVNTQSSLSWTQTLSKQTFFEVRLSRYSAHVRGDANGKSFDAYLEPQDIVTYPVRYFNQGQDTVGVVPGDGFYDLGSPTSWRDHAITEYTGKFDLTNFFTEKNKFKAGLEMRFQHMQMVDLVRPWIKPLGYDNDIYTVDPAQGAVYAAGQHYGERHVAQFRRPHGLLGAGEVCG